MVVTNPFNYGNVLQTAANIDQTRARTNALQAQTDELESTRDNRQTMNEIALMNARGPIIANAAQAIVNSNDPVKLAQQVVPSLVDKGILPPDMMQSISGPLQSEQVVGFAQGLLDRYNFVNSQQAEYKPITVRNPDGSETTKFYNPANPNELIDPGLISAAEQPDALEMLKLRDAQRASLLAQQESDRELQDDIAKGETDLRKEFNQLTSSYRLVDSAYSRILASADNPSPAGDLALIFNYMKMLDPGSTVREGEYANAQNSGSIPQRIQGIYNSLVNGERLDNSVRADFVDRAESLYLAASKTAEEQAKFYGGLAEQRGFNPDNVLGGFNPREITQNDGGWEIVD